MDVNPGRPIYITVGNFGKVHVELPEHQKVGKVTKAHQEIAHIEDECFSNPSGANATKTDSFVNTVHYKPLPDRFKPMAELAAVKEKDYETRKKD